MFSIILNSYAPTKNLRHMDMACLAAIRKFTDPPYEIIIVDNDQTHRLRDDYGVLQPFHLIENHTNQTVYRSYNQGAALAEYDKLVFIQSDVFCHERTINKLVKYLDEYEVAFPQQIPISREDVKQIYKVKDGKETHLGQRDAGMIAMRKDAFIRCGGWDERFHNLLGEKAFFARWAKHNVSWTDHTNAFITHIMAGNNLAKDEGLYNDEMAYDAQLIEKYYE